MLRVSERTRVGILGGTFDPIHLGHVDAARAARSALQLDEVKLVPARVPPHRTRGPQASARQRLTMVQLTLEDVDVDVDVDGNGNGLTVSDLELQSEDPSYTSVTLQKLRETGLQPWQLFFITGADAFAEIATWHDYPEVLNRSHFVVVSRTGHRASDLTTRLPDLASRMRVPDQTLGQDPIETPGIWLVERDTRDISSSDVRRRLASGLPIDDLVSRAVAAYISQHHLYAPGEPVTTLHE